MKSIYDADLNNLHERYQWFAIGREGDLHGYEGWPVPDDSSNGYKHQRTAIWMGSGYYSYNSWDRVVSRSEIEKRQASID